MIIAAKASHKPEQLIDRVNKGFTDIELQLTSDFLNKNKDMNMYYSYVLDKKWNIASIHMPLISGGQDINLEFLTHPDYNAIFIEVCQLAQKCAEFYEHDVTVVLHNSFSLRMYKLIPDLFKNIKELFHFTINSFPNVTYSFENLFPINIKHEYIFLQNCSFLENVEIAKYFNNLFNKKYFFTTLDICHMLCALKIMELYKDEPRYQNFSFTIEDFISGTKDTINNIHLNNIVNMGIEKSHHSSKFDKNKPEDIKLLNEILELYQKYNLNCNITIEIDELNYNNAIFAEECKELILSIVNNKQNL